jgi:putative membrane-bound dehydrogenase-like protein
VRFNRSVFAAGFSLVFNTGQPLSGSTLPQPLPSWRIELVAESPKINHPSVATCAPDGRVFVAEDPMDISLPKADAAAGRILCISPDGATTIFAEHLHAVFGLQYLEGKLYVLHNPNFSVFDDDNGVGRNRHELIEQTLPDPSALNWNDHVPANFKLAMDGYFYVASGDKGLHGAKGTDGSRADLFTGGLFRIRPDGTGLEVFSDGVRNVLDVALDAEDEKFTYDNTDEHDWMGRFTHMVEGGFYGYPHDFIPRRTYTLWMMEDFGPGAACGAFAYNEDALPSDYQGNIFLADFGKRQIMRVRLQRDGASFRAISKDDLFPDPPGDFRPVGITPGADGKSIYICDWQHRDEKAAVDVGRLFKLTWTGPDQAEAKPNWFLPAASGKGFDASASELIDALSHPSRNVRLTAQRRLSDRHRHATEPLLALLRNASAAPLARSHAIWALDAIESGKSCRKEILAATSDSAPLVRRQAIRELGSRRAPEAVDALLDHLTDSDPPVRFEASSALGRIGMSAAIPALLAALPEQDFFAHYAIFTALHRIGTNSPAGWSAIVRGLSDANPHIVEGTALALRETYDLRLLQSLIEFYRDPNQRTASRLSALRLISALHHRKPSWKGEWWAYHPALQAPPAKTHVWPGTELVLQILREGLRDKEPELRHASIESLAATLDFASAPELRHAFLAETNSDIQSVILRSLGAMKDTNSISLVAGALNNRSALSIAGAAVEAAEQIGGEASIQALIPLLNSSGVADSTLEKAIAALGNLRATPALSSILPLTNHPIGAIRAATLKTVAHLQSEASLPLLESGLADADLNVRRAAVKALAELNSTNAIAVLLIAYRQPKLQSDAFAALVRLPDQRAIDPLLNGLSSKNPTERNAAHLAILNISDSVLQKVESRLPTLSPQALVELRHIYAGNKKAENGPLFVTPIKQYSIEEYMSFATRAGGNALRGQKLFSEPQGLNCVACHRVRGAGNDVGPDLTGIGLQFDRQALAEAVLFPSKTVREGYQQILIQLVDDSEFSGVVKAETAETLTIRDSAGREWKLPRSSIKSRRTSALSLMPEGLQAALTLEEFSDLIAYLGSLKGR